MSCEQQLEDRLDLLYGEATPEIRERAEAHLAGCRDCKEELKELGRLRRDLQTWKLPANLGSRFKPSVWRPLGAGLAAAALLLLAVGGILGWRGAEFRYEDGRLSARFGPAPAVAELEEVLEEQERRHARQIETLSATLPGGSVAPDSSALLEEVRALILASEERQQRDMHQRLAAFSEQTARDRRYDLARISASLSYLDGQAGQHMARTTQLVGYMLQASEEN